MQYKPAFLGAEVMFFTIAELRTWKVAQIAWEAFQVALMVRFWAWPRIQAWIRPDPTPPAEA